MLKKYTDKLRRFFGKDVLRKIDDRNAELQFVKKQISPLVRNLKSTNEYFAGHYEYWYAKRIVSKYLSIKF